MIDSHFKSLGYPIEYIMQSSNIATIKQLAISGMGLALPKLTGDGLSQLRSAHLESIPGRDGSFTGPAARGYRACLRM